jgi:multicomponent K+:H+ antiporter subunit G
MNGALHDLPLWLDILLSLLVAIAAFFALVGSWALVKLPDVLQRLHGPTKATTLGVGCALIASAVWFAIHGSLGVHELLITLFLFLTAPVSAHILVQAAWQDNPALRPPPPPK